MWLRLVGEQRQCLGWVWMWLRLVGELRQWGLDNVDNMSVGLRLVGEQRQCMDGTWKMLTMYRLGVDGA